MAHDDLPLVALLIGLGVGAVIVGGALLWWISTQPYQQAYSAARGDEECEHASLTNHETITYYTLKGVPHTIKVEREVY
jgi:hypothetical protein